MPEETRTDLRESPTQNPIIQIWKTEPLTSSSIEYRLQNYKQEFPQSSFYDLLRQVIFPPLREISPKTVDINAVALNAAFNILGQDRRSIEVAQGGAVNQILLTESFLRMRPSEYARSIEKLVDLTTRMIQAIEGNTGREIPNLDQTRSKCERDLGHIIGGAASSAIARRLITEILEKEFPQVSITDESPPVAWDIFHKIDAVFKKGQDIFAVMQSKSQTKKTLGMPSRPITLKLEDKVLSFDPKEYTLQDGEKFYFTLLRSKELGLTGEELRARIPQFDNSTPQSQHAMSTHFNNQFLYFLEGIDSWKYEHSLNQQVELLFGYTNFRNLKLSGSYTLSSFVKNIAEFVQNR